jgi:hypothetical protein
MSLHYHKIVQNQWYGYPDEWFPSVSSTIGDRYPERSFFQLCIAITSGAFPLAVVEPARRFETPWSLTAPLGRSSVRPCWPLVPLDSKARPCASQDRCGLRPLPHLDLWRVDVRHLDRRARQARRVYDFVPRSDAALDGWMHHPEPAECEGHQVPEVPGEPVLRHARPAGLLLYPAQSAPGSWWWVPRRRSAEAGG